MARHKAKGNVLDAVSDDDRMLEEAAAAPLDPQADEAMLRDSLAAYERGESQEVQEVIDDLQEAAAADDVSRETIATDYCETSIDAPLEVNGPGGYVSTHVEVQLSGDQARGLHRLWRALDHRGDRLTSGRRVTTRPDAVRWLLEQLAAAE